MKKNVFFILLFLALPFISKAEYNGFYIDFTIETVDGKSIQAYNYLPSGVAANNLETEYELLLKNHFSDGLGSYAFHENMISYMYKDYWLKDSMSHIFILMDKKGIEIEKVKSVKINHQHPFSYLINGSIGQHFQDRKWIEKESEERFLFSAGLCEYQLFVHEKNETTDAIILELEVAKNNYDSTIQTLEKVMEESDGTEYYEAQEKLEVMYEEGIDEILQQSMERLIEQKVVVVSFCSC